MKEFLTKYSYRKLGSSSIFIREQDKYNVGDKVVSLIKRDQIVRITQGSDCLLECMGAFGTNNFGKFSGRIKCDEFEIHVQIQGIFRLKRQIRVFVKDFQYVFNLNRNYSNFHPVPWLHIIPVLNDKRNFYIKVHIQENFLLCGIVLTACIGSFLLGPCLESSN